MTDQEKLSALKAEIEKFDGLQKAATDGPWEVERRWSNGCEIIPRITCKPNKERGCGRIADLTGAPYLGHTSTLPNAEFIARARNTNLPELALWAVELIDSLSTCEHCDNGIQTHDEEGGPVPFATCWRCYGESLAKSQNRITELETELAQLRAERQYDDT